MARKPDSSPNAPHSASEREQERKARQDQHQQEQKLREADQVDKGPSACSPTGRR